MDFHHAISFGVFRARASTLFALPIVFPRAILTLSMELIDAEISFMQIALEEARAASAAGEVPIGACIVHDGKILARSGNRTIRDCDPTAHAEIIVIREAARLLRNYRILAIADRQRLREQSAART